MNTISIDTKKFPKYNQSELEQLIVKAQGGCVESREKVVESNLKLVLKILHRFKGREREFEDMFQMGVIGLIKCIDNFDINRGLMFSTYAFPMILGEMKRYLRDHLGTMRVSRSIKENNQKILYFKDEFLKKNFREPTISEISRETGIDEEDVLMSLDAHLDMLSFSQPTDSSEGNDLRLEDKIADKQNPIESWAASQELKDCLTTLSASEKLIIEKRYFDNKIQQEIAEELSISQAQVSRLEKRSLKKLNKII
jgi:RNA polymerase sporulation-specific sigma factor